MQHTFCHFAQRQQDILHHGMSCDAVLYGRVMLWHSVIVRFAITRTLDVLSNAYTLALVAFVTLLNQEVQKQISKRLVTSCIYTLVECLQWCFCQHFGRTMSALIVGRFTKFLFEHDMLLCTRMVVLWRR